MRFQIFITAVWICLMPPFTLSQQALPDYDASLNSIHDKYEEESNRRKDRIREFITKASPAEVRKISRFRKSGIYLYDVEQGHPMFRGPFNIDAAEAIGITDVRNNNAYGITLRGEGMEIGLWDSGIVRTTHQELEGRVLYFDAAGNIEIDFHATGVAGTMIASGINSRAMGMAPEAVAIAYNFQNDESEMVQAQMNRSLSLSNHSYGLVAGWHQGEWLGDPNISREEDYKFGFYNGTARTWDEIAFNAPYYLIVRSAGNDRGDSGNGNFPSDGPYDIITGAGNAKNILTVGAVRKSSSGYDNPQLIQQSLFSSWGPTDDGRIKPDLVTIGVGLFTSDSDSETDYQTIDGTSFSCPSATGGLALVQQFYRSRYNSFMKSSSLKGLALHTIREIGAEGPDYRSGWGLLNVNRMIDFLFEEDGVNKIIHEDELLDGHEIELELNPADNSPITATLCWTDPPGSPVSPSLDPPDLMLVNDLDMRLVDEVGNEYLPYVLNPANPALNAQKGDNFRDNVEKIYFPSAEPRKYFLRVKHKGALKNGSQEFSLIIDYESENSALESMYWVGNSGSWNDMAVWSFSSGGASEVIVPDTLNKVIIDDNSVSGENDVITLDRNYEIGSLTSINSEPVILDLNGFDLIIRENTILASQDITVRNGRLILRNPAGKEGLTLNLDKTIFEDVSVIIDDNNKGEWVIMNSQVALDDLVIRAGSLSMLNSNLNLKDFSALQGSGTTVILEESRLEINDNLRMEEEVVFQDAGNNRIMLNASNGGRLGVLGQQVNSEMTVMSSTLEIDFTGSVLNKLVLDNVSVISMSSLQVNDFAMIGLNEILFDPGSVIDIEGAFQVENSASDINRLIGQETEPANIIVRPHVKLCFDFMDISHVFLTGDASVSVGEFSTLNNAPGWFEGPCENLLFADFKVDYLCEKALGFFEDLSQGNVAERAWFVDGELIGLESEATYFFDAPGNFFAELEVEDPAGIKSSWSQTLEVQETTLDSNYIITNPTQLVSFRPADTYQWYKNGVPIPGATNRVYEFNDERALYFVLTFKDGCNRKSEELDLRTSVIEILPGNEEQIHVYPSPASQLVHLDFGLLKGSVRRALIYNNLGQLKLVKSVDRHAESLTLDIGSLPDGLYYLLLEGDEISWSHKLVKAILSE